MITEGEKTPGRIAYCCWNIFFYGIIPGFGDIIELNAYLIKYNTLPETEHRFPLTFHIVCIVRAVQIVDLLALTWRGIKLIVTILAKQLVNLIAFSRGISPQP